MVDDYNIFTWFLFLFK